jgi:hypothetical protein
MPSPTSAHSSSHKVEQAMAEALIQRLYDSEINLTVQFSSFYD